MTEIPQSSSGKSARQVARDAALRAGEILVQRFRTSISVSYKGRGNIVTDVDTEVEEEVLGILRREYPAMGLLGEESSGCTPARATFGSSTRWTGLATMRRAYPSSPL